MKRRDDFLVGPREKTIAAIKAGNTEEALKYFDQTCQLSIGIHNQYCNGLSLMQGTLAKIKGEKWFSEFTRKRIYDTYRVKFAPWKDMTVEQRVEAACNIHRAHSSQFHVEEYKDKFIIAVTACNAGGRLIRDGIARQQDALVKEAYPWAFNRVGLPHYCIHAYFFKDVWQELGIKAEVQWGAQYDEQGKPIDEPCKYVLYK